MSESKKGRVESAGPEAMELAQMGNRSVDETLRMIARMPAPEGLEERVKAGLRLAGSPGRVLGWPVGRNAENVWMRTGWLRGAAAAAIALVVVGGGWGIYARVAPARSAKIAVVPATQPSGTSQPGAFGEAGAKRRPLTVTGAVVKPATHLEGSKPVEQQGARPVPHSQVSKSRPRAPLASGVPAPVQ